MRRATLVLAVALLGLGCDSANQNPFIVRVTDINNGGATLLADVIAVSGTGGAFIPTELVPIKLANRKYSATVTPDAGTAWYDFQMTRYEVHWRWAGTPMAGVDLGAFDHVESTALVVPFGGEAQLNALIVPLAMKTTSPFVDLGANGQVIVLVADIDFVGGSAIDPANEVHVHTSLSVSFANFADAN